MDNAPVELFSPRTSIANVPALESFLCPAACYIILVTELNILNDVGGSLDPTVIKIKIQLSLKCREKYSIVKVVVVV